MSTEFANSLRQCDNCRADDWRRVRPVKIVAGWRFSRRVCRSCGARDVLVTTRLTEVIAEVIFMKIGRELADQVAEAFREAA